MKFIIILQAILAMIIVDQNKVLAKPNPSYHSSSLNNNQNINRFPDDLKKYPENFNIIELETQTINIDDFVKIINDTDTGYRTMMDGQRNCPKGSVFTYGKCRLQHSYNMTVKLK